METWLAVQQEDGLELLISLLHPESAEVSDVCRRLSSGLPVR